MKLTLLVIRSANMQQLADFYMLLGFQLDYHKHGNSPYHYSASLGDTVLEIYPLAKNQSEADKHLRLGLKLDNFDQTINRLKENQVRFFQEPIQTDFGYMAVVADPDGRKLELYKG